MSELGSPFGQGWPERFNLCTYFLDHNVQEGRGAKTALICGDRSHTYASLRARVIRLTAALRDLGLGAEDRVLIVLPDGLEFAETWFAILRAGGVFAMVNPLLKAKDFSYYLEYSQARVLVTDSSVLPEIGEAARSSPHLRGVLVVGGETEEFTSYEKALGDQPEDSPAGFVQPTGPDDLAGWLFTSGSTGEPKACVHRQRDFAFSSETFALQVAGYREDDVCLSVPKLFFGYATGTNLMFPFRVGATAILFPERSTPDALFDLIALHRPTFLTSVPTLINSMLRSERCDQADLSSLRVCLSAGEALPASLYEQWMERTGVEILDGIGSAEMFHIYISNRVGDVRIGSLGKLVPGYEAEILGLDGEAVATGEPGRLRIRGGSTALCYWGDEAKSIETFQADACTTEDIFRVDDEGYFQYVGRGDDLLKVSGIWVSPLEIENALLDHPAVDEVCVVGKADTDDLIKPQAFVVLADGHPGDDALAGDLKAHLKERLAPYKYPRWFEWCEELPKNDRGKVNRSLLKSRK
jgi:benzoate-CoA ligase